MIALSTPDIQFDIFYNTPFKNAKPKAALVKSQAPPPKQQASQPMINFEEAPILG